MFVKDISLNSCILDITSVYLVEDKIYLLVIESSKFISYQQLKMIKLYDDALKYCLIFIFKDCKLQNKKKVCIENIFEISGPTNHVLHSLYSLLKSNWCFLYNVDKSNLLSRNFITISKNELKFPSNKFDLRLSKKLDITLYYSDRYTPYFTEDKFIITLGNIRAIDGISIKIELLGK